MRYIVATDDSAASDQAVAYASRHAVALNATLEIVHVLAPDTELIDGEIVMTGGDTAYEAGQQTVKRAQRLAREHASDTPPAVETALLTGRPADALTDHAKEIDADGLYLGHRGLDEKREQVVGSVAKSVLDKATVPVTIIR
ncbi:MAG: universal stress protein UspA related nucleotide-binding protein [halophilic archaeon J07HX5]|jgi:Universal stress protein UspA and related nucleotide-binding proteins|nr:MAG: universal stress protein UspA related nucleotide-binding protein [halophilic archaeon J07HX5]